MISTANIAISVIIPVFNGEEYLPRCLKSVAAQTLSDIEIICINDGSTDNCGKILNTFTQKDPRFYIIHQHNQGLSASRNLGMEIAKGKYIFFLDADDYILPQTLEAFYTVAEKSQSPIVVSSKFFREGKDTLNENKIDCSQLEYQICTNPLKDIYQHPKVSAVVWNKLYQTELARNFRFINGIFYEDWPFTTCLFSNINDFALINEKFYVYNTFSTSIIRSGFTIKKIHDYILGIRYVFDYFQKHGTPQQWRIVRRNRIGCSLKMILSKISKTTEEQKTLERYFKKEYDQLVNENIVSFADLGLKSKFRLLRLMWHLRKR